MSVWFDGERLCVQLNRNLDYKVVLRIAEDSEYSEYLQDVGIYCLPPTRKNARLLYDAGYRFDETAQPFLRANEKSREGKTSDITDDLYP